MSAQPTLQQSVALTQLRPASWFPSDAFVFADGSLPQAVAALAGTEGSAARNSAARIPVTMAVLATGLLDVGIAKA